MSLEDVKTKLESMMDEPGINSYASNHLLFLLNQFHSDNNKMKLFSEVGKLRNFYRLKNNSKDILDISQKLIEEVRTAK